MQTVNSDLLEFKGTSQTDPSLGGIVNVACKSESLTIQRPGAADM
jgi:hypothetical protein